MPTTEYRYSYTRDIYAIDCLERRKLGTRIVVGLIARHDMNVFPARGKVADKIS